MNPWALTLKGSTYLVQCFHLNRVAVILFVLCDFILDASPLCAFLPSPSRCLEHKLFGPGPLLLYVCTMLDTMGIHYQCYCNANNNFKYHLFYFDVRIVVCKNIFCSGSLRLYFVQWVCVPKLVRCF